MSCDCCELALNYPDLTVRRYSQGCNWCAARYLSRGGQADIRKWACYGVDPRRANELRRMGELIDPDLKRRKR